MKKSYPIHIRFNDIDGMGHVNNAVYLSYFEQARMDHFGELVGKNWNWETEGVLLARNEVDYKVPILLHDAPRIEVWISHMGTKSMEVSYRIVKEVNGMEIECTTGKSVVVSFNYKTQKSIPVPEEWREKFKGELI